MSVPDTEEEVLNWLPEIQAVRGGVQDDVLELFVDHVPDYLWVVRGSMSHHPIDHRSQHGLILHIKRSFYAWLRIERMLKELSMIDSFEANCGRAAILAHDAFKYGKEEWYSEDDDVLYHDYVDDEYIPLVIGLPKYTDREHGAVCADHIEQHFDFPKEIPRCIRTHNGGWTDDPNPDTILEVGHHLADAMSSDIMCQWRVHDPEGMFEDSVMSLDPIIREGQEVDDDVVDLLEV